MKFADTTFPNEIIEALKENRLVIFSGAGVSRGEPANLPSYKALANKIANQTGEIYQKDQDEEPRPDEFLDRLYKKDYNVHEITYDIFNNAEAKPTSLHRNILEIFQTPDDVKLVTTNYDLLFENAAQEVFSKEPDSYSFPAIPLGLEVNGIVHLHGSLKSGSSSLVLTASDFSRHYIGRGRCSQFLYDLFENYVVLFVGYSHEDTIMKYLARGLPSPESPSRFLLIPESDFSEKKRQMVDLGLNPLPFPTLEDNSYKRLREAVREFSNHINRGAMDNEFKIKQIVEAPPGEFEKDDDFIKWTINHTDTVHFFTKHAVSEWAFWLQEEGIIDPLFKRGELSRTEKKLSGWIASKIANKGDLKLLGLLKDINSGKELNQTFAKHIFLNLQNSDEKEVLNKWINLLPIEDLFSNYRSSGIAMKSQLLIKKCIVSGAYESIPVLFRSLTKPFASIEPKRSFPIQENGGEKGSKKEVSTDFGFRFEFQLITNLWDNYITSNLSYLADGLWQVFFDNLKRIFDLYKVWDKGSASGDPISFRRSGIEPHEQDEINEPSDFLINGMRDILEFYLKNESKKAQGKIENLPREDFLIFKGLAIHGIRKSKYSSDEKLNWLLNHDFLLNHNLRHEVFLLFKEEYSNASKATRDKVLKSIDSEIDRELEEAESDEEERSIHYKKFNILYWLNKYTPDYSKLVALLNEISEEYPDFRPREYPDLTFYRDLTVEEVRKKRDSPFIKKELLEQDPEEKVEFYLTFEGDRKENTSRGALLRKINEVSEQEFEWGLKLAKVLKHRGKWRVDLWSPLLRGWQDYEFSTEEWGQLFDFLDTDSLIEHQREELSQLMVEIIGKEKNSLPRKYFEVADQLAGRIWKELERTEESVKEIDYTESPVFKARNSTAGDLTLFWLKVIEKENKNGTDSQGIPERYKKRLARIVNNRSTSSKHGQMLIGKNLNFLFSLEPPWVKNNLLTLFDTNEDFEIAQSLWHGYLRSGRLEPSVTKKLEENYRNIFPQIDEVFPGERYVDHFFNHVVLIASYYLDNPLDNWLRGFIAQVSEDYPKKFAEKLKNHLDSMEEKRIKGLWNRWLKEFWELRNSNSPNDFSRVEAGAMGRLLLELQPVLKEAVEIFTDGPVPDFQQSFFYHELKESELPSNHPNLRAKILIHSTKSPDNIEFWGCRDLKDLTETLIGNNAQEHIIKSLLDNLAQGGCRELDRLLSMNQGEAT